jgi:predicted DsbA family dithiol-disulfide isomerase
MTPPPVRIWFDFVDPLSFLLSRELAASGARVAWAGFELRPPPAPLTTAADPLWAERWREATARAERAGVELRPPRLVPWTRKAHELHTFAAARDLADPVRASIFEAYFLDGRDIGRVDVLVDVAVAAGIDRTEAKAVLDVDRHEADVSAARAEAEALGVDDVPTVFVDGELERGFPDPGRLGTLLPHR